MVNVRHHTTSVVLGLIGILCLISSCDDKESCPDCGVVTSSFDNKRFLVFFSELDTSLVHIDTAASTAYSFRVCSSGLLRSLDNQNIVEVSGSFRQQCMENHIQRIDINELVWLSTCLPQIPQLDGPYSLNNLWHIQHIQTPDTIIYTPCEGASSVEFQTAENNIHGTIAVNWFDGTYSVINDSTFQMPQDYARSLAVGNRAQGFFERSFHSVVGPSSIITHSIKKNRLILKNKASNSQVSLFLME